MFGETLAIPIINDLIYPTLPVWSRKAGSLTTTSVGSSSRKDSISFTPRHSERRVGSFRTRRTEYGRFISIPSPGRPLPWSQQSSSVFRGGEHAALDFGVPLSIGKKSWGTLQVRHLARKVEREVVATVKRRSCCLPFSFSCSGSR